MNKEEVKYFIERLWIIAELYYPNYYKDDFIAELEDWWKVNYDDDI